MKSTVESSPHHLHHSNPLGIRSADAKVHKSKHKEEENEEIKAYLNKLQEIVPFMPKHKKLSKLEVITYVIDYIRDLRQTLGLPLNNAAGVRLPMIPSSVDVDMDQVGHVDGLTMSSTPTTPTNINNNVSSAVNLHHLHAGVRQPLSLISTPNNTASLSSCGSQEF